MSTFPQQQLATIQPARTELSIPDMMQAIIEKGITAESVQVMKDLLTMKREVDADTARAAFNQDFLELRKECRPIAATRTIPTNNGGVKGRFASLEDIVGEVSPLLEKYGFSDTYSQSSVEGGRTKVTVTLLHRSGHERSSEYTCREHSSPANTPAQNDGGTNKMARRHALCNMLGIVLDYNSDARLEGDTITTEEAEDLQHRVRAVCAGDESHVDRYLKLAGAKAFCEIRRAKYEVVIQQLERSEKAPRPSPAQSVKQPVKAELAVTIQGWAKVPKDRVLAAVLNYAQRVGERATEDGKLTDEQAGRVLARAKADIEAGRTFEAIN